MHKLLGVLTVLLLFFSFTSTSDSFDMTSLNGTVRFKSHLIAKYMKKHGCFYIKEVYYKGTLKTNVFAAKDAEVIIKNKYNAVLAEGRTDDKGAFEFSVPKDNIYNIIVRFRDRETEETVSYEETGNYIADMGHYDTAIVERWFPMPPVTYCYTCNIRYLERKESL